MVTLAIDFVMVNLAFVFYYWIRVKSGWFQYSIEPEFILPMFAVYFYWLLCYAFFALYRSWYAQSRLDELLTLFRTTVLGALVLFFLIFIDDSANDSRANSRLLIFVYWSMVFSLVAVRRLTVRAIPKRLLIAGIGARNTLIVGWAQKAFQLCDRFSSIPPSVIK